MDIKTKANIGQSIFVNDSDGKITELVVLKITVYFENELEVTYATNDGALWGEAQIIGIGL